MPLSCLLIKKKQHWETMTEVSASSCPVDEGGAHPRARWANRKEFLFTMAGQMIDFRAFYIFPILVYSFGGCK